SSRSSCGSENGRLRGAPGRRETTARARSAMTPPPLAFAALGSSMLPFLLSTLLLAAPDEPPPARPVPELPRSPKVDGVLGDFRGGLPLTAKPLEGASALLTARVGSFRDTLYVALDVDDATITDP